MMQPAPGPGAGRSPGPAARGHDRVTRDCQGKALRLAARLVTEM